jgi:DNA-binding response OmpR family regulator
MKILIVEDQPRVGLFVEKALAEQGYSPLLAGTCAAARQAAARSVFAAIILDLGLPDGDGLDLLREWRAAGLAHPVLILSARDAIADRIEGLNLGADDYLPKPFSIDELVARVRSLLRRNTGVKSTVLKHGPLHVDLVGHVVTLDGARIEMTRREFSLLEFFLQNPGRILTRTLIAEKVWETGYDMETNLIDVYVRRLRRKLEPSSDRPLIKTVRGTGYELV